MATEVQAVELAEEMVGAAARQRKMAQEQAKTETMESRLGYRVMKRAFDIVASLCALILLSPVFLIVAIAIKLDSKGPVIFTQTRVGKDSKSFRFYKFRSMCVDAEQRLEELKTLNEKDGPIFKMKDDPRVTRVGKFIRKTSIDELPQLLNVFLGNMSLVGPRPPLPNEVEQYTPYQMQRLSVKGGLTCYWQVSGRSDLDFNTWVDLDLKYIRERSIWVDFRMLLLTIPALIRSAKKGAY